MDGVGEINIAKKLLSHKLMTALTKQHSIKQIGSINNNSSFHNFVALSCGTSPDSFNRLNSILKKYPKFQFICIDVANGYSENFSHFVSNVRKNLVYVSPKSGCAVSKNDAKGNEEKLLPQPDF